jgi:prevent-host-death family protein
MEVSIRDLKAQLSAYIRRVNNGEEVRITRHGRTVARLAPAPPMTGAEASREEVAQRIRAIPGLIPAEEGKPRGLVPPIRTVPGEKTFADIVSEGRG